MNFFFHLAFLGFMLPAVLKVLGIEVPEKDLIYVLYYRNSMIGFMVYAGILTIKDKIDNNE